MPDALSLAAALATRAQRVAAGPDSDSDHERDYAGAPPLVAQLGSKVEALTRDRNALAVEVGHMQQHNKAEVHSAHVSGERELVGLRDDIQASQTRLASELKAVADLTVSKADLEQRLSKAQEHVGRAQDDVLTVRQLAAEAQAAVTSLTGEVATLSGSTASLRQEGDDLADRLHTSEATANAAKKKLRGLQVDVKRVSDELAAAQSALQEAEARAAAATRDRDRQHAASDLARHKQEWLTTRISELQQKRMGLPASPRGRAQTARASASTGSQAEEREERATTTPGRRTAMPELRIQLSEMQADIRTKTAALAELRTQRETIDSQRARQQASVRDANLVRNQLGLQMRHLKEDREDLEVELEEAEARLSASRGACERLVTLAGRMDEESRKNAKADGDSQQRAARLAEMLKKRREAAEERSYQGQLAQALDGARSSHATRLKLLEAAFRAAVTDRDNNVQRQQSAQASVDTAVEELRQLKALGKQQTAEEKRLTASNQSLDAATAALEDEERRVGGQLAHVEAQLREQEQLLGRLRDAAKLVVDDCAKLAKGMVPVLGEEEVTVVVAKTGKIVKKIKKALRPPAQGPRAAPLA